ncbi:MAG: sigma 54-interacting transcriptional regulator [Sphingomonadaceae bacterium]|nr:sigma 54-interacting transcriptional regulator [Sphingomonadaceae bacterium]
MRVHPRLASAVKAGDSSLPPLNVGVAGEGADMTVARAAAPSLRFHGGCQLSFDDADLGFALALIAAGALPATVPAGDSASTRALLTLARKVAASDVGVLICGPTGTGKEGLARFVHAGSARRHRQFVGANCAAIPDTLLEATLFGTERGAFTGSTAATPGLFRAANGGTLLLDEVGEMSLPLQAKLLRALQEREVLPVGAARPVATDVRVIGTCNRDLLSEVAAGRFRADLFYRLAVFPLTTTALAARPDDLVPIVAALWLRQRISAWPTVDALARLAAHPWPGNVRELGSVLARAAILADGGIVGAEQIVFDTIPDARGLSLDHAVRLAEQERIRSALAGCEGHRGRTARALGISERTLRYKLASISGSTTLQ